MSSVEAALEALRKGRKPWEAYVSGYIANRKRFNTLIRSGAFARTYDPLAHNHPNQAVDSTDYAPVSEQLSLRGADLSGLDLKGYPFFYHDAEQGINTDVDLSRCRVDGTDLRQAKFGMPPFLVFNKETPPRLEQATYDARRFLNLVNYMETCPDQDTKRDVSLIVPVDFLDLYYAHNPQLNQDNLDQRVQAVVIRVQRRHEKEIGIQAPERKFSWQRGKSLMRFSL